MGLEPTTFGITIRRSNRLSYIYRVVFGGAKILARGNFARFFCKNDCSDPSPYPYAASAVRL
jgi:hypothetical protein